MNVTTLVDLMALNLGQTTATPTPKQRADYVKFLNLANLELYAIAAPKAKTMVKIVDVFFPTANVNNQSSTALPDDLYFLRKVYSKGAILLPRDLDKLMNVGTGEYVSANGQIFTNTNTFDSKVAPDATTKKYATLTYVPKPKTLVENIIDNTAETDKPIYPEPLRYILVQGALYYLRYSNQGSLETEAAAQFISLKNWEAAKNDFAVSYDKEG